jgi:hypothetical protein
MTRLPDRYYDLELEIGQLKEEEEALRNQQPVDLNEIIRVRQLINELREELLEFEEPAYRYVISREVIDLENPEDEYYFTKEYDTEEEAWESFETQVDELKELFTEVLEMKLENGMFHISDSGEEVNLIIYKYLL